ncbi:MAG: deoxyribodipyrimidine photo-lyase, partial [Pseudomonadota bacterium]
MASGPIILWYRQDLRLIDHPALRAAHDSGRPVIPLFIWHDDAEPIADTRIGGAARWWLHHSLDALDQSLQERGSQLIIRKGAPATVLPEIVEETGATALYFTRRYEARETEREQALRDALAGPDFEVKRFGGRLLREPSDVETKSGGPYKV